MKITIREPGSALTHYIAMMLAMLGAVPLLMKATNSQDMRHVVSMLIFICSMVLLYGASTLYHSVNLTGKALKAFKKVDHMMIFVLIAGSYTPVCMLVLDKAQGYPLLALVWGTAVLGMLIKFFWVTCPKWFSSIIYIGMGVRIGISPIAGNFTNGSVPLAFNRWDYLYRWWRDLCTQGTIFR